MGGGFPDQVGEVASGGQPLQRGGVHVGARGRPWPGQARPVQVPEVSSVLLWSRTWASWSRTQVIRSAPLSPGPGMLVAVIVVASWSSGCTGVPSLSGLPVGVAVRGALEDLRGRRISGLGGCRIASVPGPVQAGNARPRSP